MLTFRWLLLSALCSTLLIACGSNGNTAPKFQCSDGKDNDGDGLIDFPDDPGCTGPDDNSEDSLPSPQCSDGRDNDGDGKIDYPNDPGCFAPQQDDETDDCPDGPSCPQCSDGKDNDGNGKTDYPDDPGCSSAADNDEYTENPVACGQGVNIQHLPFGNEATGMIGQGTGALDPATSGCLPSGTTTGTEAVYEIRLNAPKVVVASTANDLTTQNLDTVVYIRSATCTDGTMEAICNDNAVLSPTVDYRSTVTAALDPGTYYIVVDYVNGLNALNPSMGTYDLTVHFFVGEGVTCQTGDDCGPGLVCRIPLGGTDKVCSKHVCSDGVDDDGDGKNDYPFDPGCTSPNDDDETDDCPNGPMCPECGDGRDNDGDGHIDYPADPTCKSAADVSEACNTTEGVTAVTTATTSGDTTTATDDVTPSCGATGTKDLTYRIDVPHLNSLSISVTPTTFWDDIVAIYNSTCGGADLQCQFYETPISMTNVAAGTYYVVVDGEFSGQQGPFTLNVSGQIVNGASCESVLAQAGALTCGTGYACKGTVGSRTCQPAMCSDGIDNDGDGKIDYPNDPGCDSPADDTEADPAVEPVCANGMDDDGDGTTDWPADYGCAAASGTSEVFCIGETDPTSKVTVKTTTGTTAGAANDSTPTCGFSSAPEKAFAIQLPVSVATLTVDTLGSSYDTVLAFRDVQCATELACDDDDPVSGTLQSRVVMTNLSAGGYAIVVDGYSSNSGAFTLNVNGVVSAQTPCSSPLFTGANAILTCPTGTTCTGSPKKCQ